MKIGNHTYCTQIILKVAVVIVALAGVALAAGDGDTLRVSVGDPPDYQFPDSQRSFSLDLEPADSVSNFSVIAGGMIRFSTDDVNTGYGAAFGIDWSRFSPLVLRAAFDFSFYDADRPEVSGLELTGFEVDLGLLYRPLQARMQPYIGGGLSFYGNHTDESPGLPVGDIYEDGINYEDNARTGFGVHLRAGTDFRIAGNVRLWADIKYTFVRPEIEYRWVDPVTRSEQTEVVELNMETPSVSLGVTFPIK